MEKPLRVCRECGLEAHTEEDLDMFRKVSPSEQKKFNRDTLCKSCDNQRRYEKGTANKIKALQILGNRCTSCGLEYNGKNGSVFDFHHLNPTEKENTPSKLMRNSWESIEKEINKCVILCANCHRMEHSKEY